MSADTSRREFLGASAAVIPLAALASGQPAYAQSALPADNHLVPEDKGLRPEWVRGLRAKGQPEWYRGDELDRIGMPCGGIGCGQLYLRGDGSLTSWRIFNRPTGPQPDVEQGFALLITGRDGTVARPLARRGFDGVTFRGEYPIGRVRYLDWNAPVRVEMSVWSPFIPLAANDSNLPATVFEIEVENTSNQPVTVATAGWLENAVGLNTGPVHAGRAGRVTRVAVERGRTLISHAGELLTGPAVADPRPARVLADFEGADYGDWKAEGEAFGARPARGTLQGQQPVTGFEGKGLVNSFLGGDGPQGRLTSPDFVIDRTHLNFQIGGGANPGQTCINLVVGDKVVRTAAGRNEEQLLWQTWDIKEFAGKTGRIEILDRADGPWGHINVDQIELADVPRVGAPPFPECEDYGTFTLACAEAGRAATASDLAQVPLPLTGADAKWAAPERRAGAVVGPDTTLAPGARHTFVWVLAWHFPNAGAGMGGNGHYYAARFADAPAVAHHVLDNHARLSRDTRLWRDTYYDSSLPWWLLDRLHSTLSYLATGTCRWFKNGRFWAWEGVNCCEGTCTHVWNYAHGQARLFPEIERIVRRQQDYGAAYDEASGLVGFRGNRAYAADGQCGTTLKAYREHLMSADKSFLGELWPKIKHALEFSMGHDGNDDGLIEDSQHNTYDINFEGPNTFVGALYLAALRAGEQMAREVGDAAFADRCKRVFEAGRRLSMERLYNGEYFIQQVDLKKHPRFQYADGCLADQLFGQGWAHHVGLGYLYPADAVKSGLKAVFKYNYAPDIGPQTRAHPPGRWFIGNGEPGLLICTWPKSRHLGENAVLYRDEVWTGIEYQVAGHMVWEDQIDEALTVCRAIHDRYQPTKRNPYNEIECGDHYSRALASWGVYTALCGYDYHGPAGRLTMMPKITPEAFRAAFTAAEGWGTFEQTRGAGTQNSRIILRYGQLTLNELTLSALPGGKPAEVKLGGTVVAAKATSADGRLALTFDKPLTIKAGQELQVIQ
ncbi:MAG: hypothetical protein HZB16_09845 [Armatimonadetes bacterium]|nr:hypothetical protein [Armatimonadota bacterium]